jgi:hypothetical protein
MKAMIKTIGCPYVILGKPQVVNGKVTWSQLTALQNPWERIREAAKLATKDVPKAAGQA